MMKKLLAVLAFTLSALSSFAQDVVTQLKILSDRGEYDKIIVQYASADKLYSAKALFYIGLAYYMKGNDTNCLKFLELSLQKDSTDGESHFLKASTLNYMQKFTEAIKSFEAAIRLKPGRGVYYSGLGDTYYNLEKNDSALLAFRKATEQADAPGRAYAMIGQILAEENRSAEALEALYTAKAKIGTASDSYGNVLYNIGQLEYSDAKYDKAGAAYNEFIGLFPGDYQPYAKLIQVYYAQEQNAKAKPLRDTLYAAFNRGVLKETKLEEMFCFDQFKWRDKTIFAYEKFADGAKNKIYYKYLFYVVSKEGKSEFSVQLEYSPISAELGGPKYVVGMSTDGGHATYNIGFNDDFVYKELKQTILNILDGKIKPTASSRYSNK